MLKLPPLKINPLCILSKLQSEQSYTADELKDMTKHVGALKLNISSLEEVVLMLREEEADIPAEDEDLKEIYREQEAALIQTIEVMKGYITACTAEINRQKAGAGTERKYHVTEAELKNMAAGVYYFDTLFKPQIQWAQQEAKRQQRPDASRFFDVWHEPLWFIGTLKNILIQNGFTWRTK